MRTISVFAACVLAAGSAGAQGLFDYSGADRMEKIVAAAKKEGTLTMYTTFAEKDQPTLIRPFEAKYGVKVNIWRAGTDKVLQRTLAEAAAKKYDVDLIHFGSPEMEALSREKILQAVNSPVHKDLQPGSVPAHREWAATLLSVWVQVYNTQLIRKEDLPRTYRDLLDPRWKGKLGIEAKNQDWFASVVDVMGGGEKGLQFFRDLVAQNGSSARAHRIQLHARAGEEKGRADRLVRARARSGPLQRDRRRPPSAASERGAPLLRIHAGRGAAVPGENGLRALEHPGAFPVQEREDRAD